MSDCLRMEDEIERRVAQFLKLRGIRRKGGDEDLTEAELERKKQRELEKEARETQAIEDEIMMSHFMSMGDEESFFVSPREVMEISERLDRYRIRLRLEKSPNTNDFYVAQYDTNKCEDDLLSKSEVEEFTIAGDVFYKCIEPGTLPDEMKEPELGANKSERDDISLPMSSSAAYDKWEKHEKKRDDKSLDEERTREQNENENETGEQGYIYDSDIAKKFQDPIQLHSLGMRKLDGLSYAYEYRNNLSVVIKSSDGNEYIVTCSGSKVKFYNIDMLTQLPDLQPVMILECKPDFTSSEDSIASTNLVFPHNINFVKIGKFGGEEVFGACMDDGRVLVWPTKALLDGIKQYSDRFTLGDAETATGVKIEPKYKLRLEFSAWGLDFMEYEGCGKKHSLIATSDNGQKINLFYLLGNSFASTESHIVAHNIPEVSFISASVVDGLHEVRLSCVDIGSELLHFLIRFREEGTVDEPENPEATFQTYRHSPRQNRSGKIRFSEPLAILRTLLPEEGWTVKVASAKYFKRVNSIFEMTGDSTVDEEAYIRQTLEESKVLNALYDPVKTSDLGLAAKYQYLFCPAKSIELSTEKVPASERAIAHMDETDDVSRRMHRGIRSNLIALKSDNNDKTRSLNGKFYLKKDVMPLSFLVVSSVKRLFLFQPDTLYCNASTSSIFDHCFNAEGESINRISISVLVPELLCIIAASQQGLVSVFRLCSYRGLFGLRQEYLLPDPSVILCRNGRPISITGLAIRNLSLGPVQRYIAYVTYTSGIILAYELTSNLASEILSMTV